jgi:hypothetical protein
MTVIQDAAKTYGGSIEPKLTSVLSRVIEDEDKLDKLTTFVRVSLQLFQMPVVVIIFRCGMERPPFSMSSQPRHVTLLEVTTRSQEGFQMMKSCSV